jgi:hypothetical protein
MQVADDRNARSDMALGEAWRAQGSRLLSGVHISLLEARGRVYGEGESDATGLSRELLCLSGAGRLRTVSLPHSAGSLRAGQTHVIVGLRYAPRCPVALGGESAVP